MSPEQFVWCFGFQTDFYSSIEGMLASAARYGPCFVSVLSLRQYFSEKKTHTSSLRSEKRKRWFPVSIRMCFRALPIVEGRCIFCDFWRPTSLGDIVLQVMCICFCHVQVDGDSALFGKNRKRSCCHASFSRLNTLCVSVSIFCRVLGIAAQSVQVHLEIHSRLSVPE